MKSVIRKYIFFIIMWNFSVIIRFEHIFFLHVGNNKLPYIHSKWEEYLPPYRGGILVGKDSTGMCVVALFTLHTEVVF